jgi:hypothetical protein
MVAKSTAVIACALLLLCAALVGAGAAGAAKGDYPAKVEKAFMKSCVKSAHSGGDGLSRKKARKYCQTAFDCIESKLTLKQFEKAAGGSKKGRKAISSCEKKALKTIS